MRVRCFTASNSLLHGWRLKKTCNWNKTNCRRKYCSFCFSKSVNLYWKKMIAIFYLALQILKLYSYVVIANVVINWLVSFNIINTQNRFVYSILEMTYKLTEPMLNRIRRFLPNLGSLDIAPVILLLLIWFIEMCMKLYIAPMIF